MCCCCAAQLTPLPRLSIDFSGHRQAYSSSSYARASSIRRSLDRCSMMPDDAVSMFRSSSWELAEEQVSSSGLVGCASLQLQQQLPMLAVGEATESLGLGELPSGLGFIQDVINETHLLQVRIPGRALQLLQPADCHEPRAVPWPLLPFSFCGSFQLRCCTASQPAPLQYLKTLAVAVRTHLCFCSLHSCLPCCAPPLPGRRNDGRDLGTWCPGGP